MIRKVLGSLLPTMIAAMLYSLYGVIDGLFVGNATGDTGLAAINIVWPLAAIIFALGIGIGNGGSIWISYYRGKGDTEEAKNIYANTLAFLMIVGLMLGLLLFVYEDALYLLGARGAVYEQAHQYIEVFIKGSLVLVLGNGLMPILRNMGMEFQAMMCMMIGLGLNVGINYYMMFVLKLGIRGAAYGTLIAQSIAVALCVILLIRNRECRICLRFDIKRIKQIMKSVVAPFGLYIAPSITLIFTNLQCLKYGGDAVVACYAVISYIVFPVLSTLGGVGDGLQPLTSYYFGAKREEMVKSIQHVAYSLLVVMGASASIAVIGGTTIIANLFGLSDHASEYFEMGMRVSALAFVLQGFVKYTISYLNATMRTEFAMLLTYSESLCINPMMLFLLPMIGGVTGIWYVPFITALLMMSIYGGYCLLVKKSHKNSMNVIL